MQPRAQQYTLRSASWHWQRYGKQIQKVLKQRKKKPPQPRRLRPRTPDACPLCREEKKHPPRAKPCEPVRPWSEVKGRAGRPKQVNSDGHACSNRACVYHGITDGSIHALVSDGRRGQAEATQYWKCQACGKKVSARCNTPLYRLKTTPRQVAEVLTALA